MYFSQPGARLGRADKVSCQFLTKNGDKCAIGCRISDAQAIAAGGWKRLNKCGTLEGLYADGLGEIFAPTFGRPGDELFRFNRELQRTHDKSTTAAEFVTFLDRLARQYELEPQA